MGRVGKLLAVGALVAGLVVPTVQLARSAADYSAPPRLHFGPVILSLPATTPHLVTYQDPVLTTGSLVLLADDDSPQLLLQVLKI
jgi:hypothetical protein